MLSIFMEGIYPSDFIIEQDRRREEETIKWNQEREKRFKSRHVEDIQNCYAEGIFTDDEWIHTVRENVDYSDEEMDSFGYLEDPTPLFKDRRQKVGFGLVDRVFELLCLERGGSWFQEDGIANRKLKILDEIGFDIPKTRRDKSMGLWCNASAWLEYYLQRTFTKYLKENHSDLYDYWEFSKWVYTLSKITDDEYKRYYEI